MSVCSGGRTSVWFEGTAHLADALASRDAPGDGARAQTCLADQAQARAEGPDGAGTWIMAASENGLSDCDGGTYDASLHTGATSWYVLAAQQVDPLTLSSPATGS